MTETLRIVSLLATAAAATFMSSPASAQAQASASAKISKPLILTRVADLNFGDILLSGTGTFSTSVTVSQTGEFTCGSNLTCTGTNSRAVYNASGNRGTLTINVPSTLTLTHAQNAGETLSMTVHAPNTLTLTNSGNPGHDFGIGGTLNLTDETLDGTYSGTFDVTVNY